MAAPVCKSTKYTFESLDRVADKTKYLGDASQYDWVADGKPRTHAGNLLLTMEPGTVGTVLASTSYVWYGKIKAVMKTSRGDGVVTAFILMSDMKDEVDYEWVGANLGTIQTNYYFQGIPDCMYMSAQLLPDCSPHTDNNGGDTKTTDTFEDWHEYEIDWTPDTLTWSVDGQVGRVLKRSDTFNETTKRYDYPQTPSRVQLSLWPGGLATNDKGTIKWAGGVIDWENSPDIKDPGYYYATVQDVDVQCYDPPDGAKKEGSKSYSYDDLAGYEDNVVIGNKGTVLKSFLGSGTNLTATYPATKSGTANLDGIETVPGLTGAGTGAGSRIDEDGSSGGNGNQSVTSSSGNNQFSQGDGKAGQGGAGPSVRVEHGSVLAIVIAVAAILIL